MTACARLSIVTDEISQDLCAVRTFLRQHRIGAVELRGVSGQRVPQLSAQDQQLLNALVHHDGVRVIGLSPGIFKGRVDDRARAQRELAESLPRTIDQAQALGADFVIAFSLETRDPSRAARDPGDERFAVECLWTAAERCAAGGKKLLIENEPGFLARTGADLRRLLDALSHPAAHANWDPCNSNQFEPDQLAAAVQVLGADLHHVHVKNGVLASGERFARCGPLGDGAIDWGVHLEQLFAAGYRGHLGIETHFEPLAEASARVVAELRELLAARGLPEAGA